MPFKSRAQARFMFATMPDTAREWSRKTKSTKKLPDHVRHKKQASGFIAGFEDEILAKTAAIVQSLVCRAPELAPVGTLAFFEH